ncbi:MAG: hypothetical protein IPQ07_15015 [Myxococcales bacterium]|nr:hypothetical protein [Myxococcales bacterium]
MSLLLALGATVAGCAADAPGMSGDDDTNPPPPDSQPVPLTPEGRFSVQSDFDLATNLPGTAGTVVNYFIQATDDPDDPTRFIVEKLVAALPNGSVKNTLNGAIPFVAGYLNDRLLQVAPDFVGKIVEVGDAFGQVAHHFGTIEVLDIQANGAAVKTVQGLHFKVDNVDLDFNFKDYGMQDVKVEGLTVQLEPSGKLNFSQHKVGLKYGQILKLALDQAIIPMIDPSAQNLGDLLKNLVNCQAVGTYVYQAVGIGSASTFESACNAGLAAAGPALYNQLDNIDGSALEFGLAGTARGIDKNKDGKMDDIATGTWTGELKYAGTPAPLAAAKFFGTKM